MKKNIFPKKSTVVKLFLVVLGLVLLILVTTSAGKSIVTKVKNGLTVAPNQVELAEVVNKDGDGDGMPDWEEVLRGSDPTDKTSMATATDPIRTEAGSSTDIGVDTTKTAQFSKELFSLVSSLTTSGATLTDEDIAKISQSAAEKIQAVRLARKTYTQSDITISSDTSVKGMALYATTVANSVKTHDITRDNPLEHLTSAGEDEGGTADIQGTLAPIIQNHNQYISELVAVSVPQSAINLHLNLLNSISTLKADVEGMTTINDDPILVIGAVSQYEGDLDSYASQLMALSNFFKNQQ